jgi:hypothetical protein
LHYLDGTLKISRWADNVSVLPEQIADEIHLQLIFAMDENLP